MRPVLVLSFGILLGGCARHDQVARVSSPDHLLDAILVESNGGATTSFGYDVYLVRAGAGTALARSIVNLYRATRNANAYGVNLKWQDSDLLEVDYLTAREVRSLRTSVQVAGKTVRVAVHGGVTDAAAPPGGMLYNLQGRPYDRK